MNPTLTAKQVCVLAVFVLAGTAAFAQAKLNVNGLKVNLANGIYLSTGDVAVNSTGLIDVKSATLKVAGTTSSTNVIDVTDGDFETNGTSAQQIPANAFASNLIKDLISNNAAGTTLNGPLTLTDVFTLTDGSFTSGGNLTLRSTLNKTARVAPVTSAAPVPAIGNIIVERFIPGKRAFRFLTAPVNSPGNIRANWMEDVANANTSTNNDPNPGYGTHITGVGNDGNGFDATNTANKSLYTYNNQTQVWEEVPNTNGNMSVGTGYRILVRGSRSTNLNVNNPPASNTTLRATGVIYTGTTIMKKPGGGGTSGMPELSNTVGGYSLIGNPYASPVDWKLLDKTDISNTIYVFDPTINGSNGRGGFISYNASISGGVNSNDTSMIDNNLQSGQAFMVQTTGANPSLTFKESYKTSPNRLVFRTTDTLTRLSLQLLLPKQVTNGGNADALAVYFSPNYSDTIGDEDSYKFNNQDENIAILRNGKLLSIEGRTPVVSTDTVQLRFWQLLPKAYYFKINLSNFESSVEAYMEDAFLHTKTRLSTDTVVLFPFSLTSDSASASATRFRVIFKNSSTLPAMPIVKAYPVNNGIQVDWTADLENSIEKYTVEKSATTRNFTDAATVKSVASSAGYNWFDANPVYGDNYYRIRYVFKNGDVKYSRIVKVHLEEQAGAITVVTEQSGSSQLMLNFKNMEKGKYALSLINTAGQKVYGGEIFHQGGSGTQTIKLKSILASGVYHLQWAGANKSKSLEVFIK